MGDYITIVSDNTGGNVPTSFWSLWFDHGLRSAAPPQPKTFSPRM